MTDVLSGNAVAVVVLRVGRWYLVVRGVYVATDGDPLPRRDLAYGDRVWTKTLLDQAANDINTNRNEHAADRWSF